MKRITAWLIALAFVFRLRRPFNDLQRWVAERNAPRAPLAHFLSPEEMVRYLRAKYEWGADKLGRFLPFGDWSSHPQVFQAELNAAGGPDGDCDDYHGYCCEQLERMPGVTSIMRVSCWTESTRVIRAIGIVATVLLLGAGVAWFLDGVPVLILCASFIVSAVAIWFGWGRYADAGRGHTTAMFTRDEQLYLIDYELLEVDSYEDALETVRFRHKWSDELAGWVFETTDMEKIAVWPRLP